MDLSALSKINPSKVSQILSSGNLRVNNDNDWNNLALRAFPGITSTQLSSYKDKLIKKLLDAGSDTDTVSFTVSTTKTLEEPLMVIPFKGLFVSFFEN